MPPAAKSDKMKLKRIRKERHARCFLKLLKEQRATKAVAPHMKSIKFLQAAIMALQNASEAFIVMKFEDVVLRALKASSPRSPNFLLLLLGNKLLFNLCLGRID